MANDSIYRVARLSDRQVIELYRELVVELIDGTEKFFGTNGLSADFGGIDELDLPPNSHFLTRAHLSSNAKGLQVEFRRGVSTGKFSDRQPSPYFDEIQISLSQQPAGTTMQDLLNVSKVIEGYGTVVQPSNDVSNFGGATDIITAEVSKLAELAAELTIGADATRRELEIERIRLQKAFEDEKQALDAAHQEREAALDTEKQKLEVLRDELDDREHKHVRRQLRDTITKELNDEITAPKSSQRSFKYVYLTVFFTMVGVLGCGYLAYEAQNAIVSLPLDTVKDPETGATISSSLSNSPQVYLLYLKMFAASAASLGLFVYTINWLRKLSSQITLHQQKLQRHVFDMNRASWTIETILELSASELPEIPEIWLQSVTSNLFEQEDQKSDDTGSLQALGALLNITSEAEIGTDGTKFKLNRRGAKKAASEVPS